MGKQGQGQERARKFVMTVEHARQTVRNDVLQVWQTHHMPGRWQGCCYALCWHSFLSLWFLVDQLSAQARELMWNPGHQFTVIRFTQVSISKSTPKKWFKSWVECAETVVARIEPGLGANHYITEMLHADVAIFRKRWKSGEKMFKRFRGRWGAVHLQVITVHEGILERARKEYSNTKIH